MQDSICIKTKNYIQDCKKPLSRIFLLQRLHGTDSSSGAFLRATDTREHTHAAEPPGPGHPAPAGRRRQLAGEFLRPRPVMVVIVRETEPVGRGTSDGEPAALRLVSVEARVLRYTCRATGDDQALVAVRRPRPPPPEGRADEREDPFHRRRGACGSISAGLKQL